MILFQGQDVQSVFKQPLYQEWISELLISHLQSYYQDDFIFNFPDDLDFGLE